MTLTIERRELKTLVAGLGRITPRTPTLPVLAAIRFQRRGDLSTASATDLDQTATYTLSSATGEGDSLLVVPIQSLRELTRGGDRETVAFTPGPGHQVVIGNQVGSHTVRFTLDGMDPAEWPGTEVPVPTRPAEGFLGTYRRLTPFASTDPTRYALNCVYIDMDGKGERPACMVAVDGRRLSVWNSMQFDLAGSVPVPVSRFLCWNGLGAEARIGLREEIKPKKGRDPASRKAWFGLEAGGWRYTVKVPEVTFPNWRQVIPDHAHEPVHCCRFSDADAESLRKILPGFPGHDDNNAAITLEGSGGTLTVGARETRLELKDGSTYEGQPGGIAVDRRYLLDALAAGFRNFTFTDGIGPMKSVDGKGGTHVLMPVRLGNPPPPKGPERVAPSAGTVSEAAPVAGATETPKENDMPEKTEEVGALDKVLLAVETARSKLRDAAGALAEVTDGVKAAVREGKAQSVDLEKARATLQKLQAISL